MKQICEPAAWEKKRERESGLYLGQFDHEMRKEGMIRMGPEKGEANSANGIKGAI